MDSKEIVKLKNEITAINEKLDKTYDAVSELIHQLSRIAKKEEKCGIHRLEFYDSFMSPFFE